MVTSSSIILINHNSFPAKIRYKTDDSHESNSTIPYLKSTRIQIPSKTRRIQIPRKYYTTKNPNPIKKKIPRKPEDFAEEDAFPSSLPLHTKNPHAIYEDIQQFARKGKIKEALAILDYMDQQGIPVNVTTFSSLLSACVRSKSLADGKQVYAYIRVNGLENNDFLRTKLVHMYTSCGSVEDAHHVFDGVTSKNVYTWNALLKGNVVSGRRNVRDMLLTFYQMRESGVELNVYSFTCLIKCFAGASSFTQGSKAHALMVKTGFAFNSILQTSLVDFYFKCGKTKLVCQLFDEILDRDIVVWGAMIAGFAHNKLHMEALKFTRMMIHEGYEMNAVILTTILPIVGDLCAHKLGKEIHAYVLKNSSYLKHLFIQSGLVDMYSKCGDLNSSRRVFYGFKERNAVSWTALISGYASNGKLDQALRSIVWMQQEGFKPDIVTIATVLPVCAQLKCLKQGKEIHSYALKNGYLPNVSITTSLMVMYSKCTNLEYCSNLFKLMDQRNVIAWTAMIEAYIGNDQLYDALALFRLMQLSKHRPDSVTTVRVMSVCGKLKSMKLCKEIHGHVFRKGFEKIPFISAEIIRMYGMCSLINISKLVFDAILIKGTMTKTAIIEAYGYNAMYKDAIHLFDSLVLDGFIPNHFTFKVVLSICGEAGFADKALRIFNLMTKTYKIKPTEENFTVIIELLTHSGDFDEAQRFIQMRSSLL